MDVINEPLNHNKLKLWSTLIQSHHHDKDIERTNGINNESEIEAEKELTVFHPNCYVLMLTNVFENFVYKSTLEYKINSLYSYSVNGYTRKSGLKHLLLLLENNIRGGISTVLGDRYVESGPKILFRCQKFIRMGNEPVFTNREFRKSG